MVEIQDLHLTIQKSTCFEYGKVQSTLPARFRPRRPLQAPSWLCHQPNLTTHSLEFSGGDIPSKSGYSVLGLVFFFLFSLGFFRIANTFLHVKNQSSMEGQPGASLPLPHSLLTPHLQ